MALPTFGTLVNSLNFYVDTSRDVGEGDDAQIQLAGNKISCGDGQLLRLCLTEFSMYKNFYSINPNNNKFRLTTNLGSGAPHELEIQPNNYRTVGNIIEKFADIIKTQLKADSGNSNITSDFEPGVNDYINLTGTRIFKVTLDFQAPHGITQFRVQCFSAVSDSYLILGGDRIDDTTSTGSSFDIDFSTDPNKVVITGRYPCQRHSEHHIYVRTDSLSNNIETASLSAATGPYDTHTLSSNILAKIPIDTEFCSLSASGPHDEFFVNLTQRSLTSLRLFLTDSKGRPLGRTSSTVKTAAGTGSLQSIRGNLNFSCTLRIDVIQKMHPNYLNSPPTPQPIPGRYSGALLTENFGRAKI